MWSIVLAMHGMVMSTTTSAETQTPSGAKRLQDGTTTDANLPVGNEQRHVQASPVDNKPQLAMPATLAVRTLPMEEEVTPGESLSLLDGTTTADDRTMENERNSVATQPVGGPPPLRRRATLTVSARPLKDALLEPTRGPALLAEALEWIPSLTEPVGRQSAACGLVAWQVLALRLRRAQSRSVPPPGAPGRQAAAPGSYSGGQVIRAINCTRAELRVVRATLPNTARPLVALTALVTALLERAQAQALAAGPSGARARASSLCRPACFYRVQHRMGWPMPPWVAGAVLHACKRSVVHPGRVREPPHGKTARRTALTRTLNWRPQ